MTLEQIKGLTQEIESLAEDSSSLSCIVDGDRNSLMVEGKNAVHHVAARDFVRLLTFVLEDKSVGEPGADMILVMENSRAPNADGKWQIEIKW